MGPRRAEGIFYDGSLETEEVTATTPTVAVNIPAGTFNLGGSFSVPSNVAVIGAGMDQTVLNTSGGSQIPQITGNNARLSGFSLISVNEDGSDGIRVGSDASSVRHNL